jgi:hypothetical protein
MSSGVQELLIGTGSALVGIVIGFFLNLLGERIKWRREQRVRYNEQRISAYATFTEAGNDVAFKSRHEYDRGNHTEVATLETRFLNSYLTVLILGTAPVREAAERYYDAVKRLAPDSSRPGTEAEKNRLYEQVGVAVEEFYRAARTELGVP